MISGTFVVAVPNAQLLFAVGQRADARIHVEHDASWRTTGVNPGRSIGPKDWRAPTEFFSVVSQRVSKRPIWLADAAFPEVALPPTIQRMAGSWRNRSASFTSSYPASRPNTACRNIPTGAMPAVLARPRIREPIASRLRKAESIVKLAIGDGALVTELAYECKIVTTSILLPQVPTYDKDKLHPAMFVIGQGSVYSLPSGQECVMDNLINDFADFDAHRKAILFTGYLSFSRCLWREIH